VYVTAGTKARFSFYCREALLATATCQRGQLSYVFSQTSTSTLKTSLKCLLSNESQ
ncbi:MAG: hypothetical protein JWN45_1619, partial [Acidobacteriaceae bacterium]|nr:hypothetical protein [Acidobacteriaceae bacterium]